MKILITAYAVNPYKGSEDGTGWNMICQVAQHHPVMAITRKNNRTDIEKYLAENQVVGAEQMTFHYFDLPYWMRFWKKGGRGALLYLYLWQIGIVFFIANKKLQFDIAHHLNFHTDLIPSFLWVFKKPFFWGPIGHHPQIPDAYLNPEDRKTRLVEKLKWMVKKTIWYVDPFLKICKWKADKIFVINSSVKKELNLSNDKLILLPAVASCVPNAIRRKSNTHNFNILSIGRFVPLKGFDMTIRAFARFYKKQDEVDQKYLRLILVGKGPEELSLKTLAENLQIAHAVDFINWMPKEKLNHHFANASVFLFPSHEGAGMVVPEALSFGLPVGCYDNIGPGEFIDEHCGFRIPYTSYSKSITDFSNYLQILFHEPELQRRLSRWAKIHFEQYFTWERKGKVISDAYHSIVFEEEVKMAEV